MTNTTTTNATGVPKANRGGEAIAQQHPGNSEQSSAELPVYKQHAERSIWTDRMLAVLETEQRSGPWYSLQDKIFSQRSLAVAADQVVRNRGASGVDRVSTAHFNRARHRLLPKLQERLGNKTYQHQAVRRVWIPKPGSRNEQRPLGIPTVMDRVVQTAVRNGLQPIYEAQFHDHSYGFRPGRSTKDALHHVARTLQDGYTWVIDADLKGFFDTIDHDILMNLIRQDIADGALLAVLQQMLQAGILNEAQPHHVAKNTTGTPQGGVISPLLANIFLNELDHLIGDEEDCVMIRYADDVVICCRNQTRAKELLTLVQQWTTARKLSLHPDKTVVVDMNIPGNELEFLGFRFVRRIDRTTGKPRFVRTMRAKSKATFRAAIKPLTKRCNGHGLTEIIVKINPIIRGYGNHFRSVVRNEMESLDQWIRMRLRSILRKRRKRKGRGRGHDHNRWTNRFFTDHGLITLTSVHDAWCQSRNG